MVSSLGRHRRTSAVRPFAPGASAARAPVPVGADEVFRELAPSVLGYLRGQGVDDPEDLLGEVFLQVARSIDGFEGDRGGLRRWVFTIARNRVVDDRRRRARRPRVVSGDTPDRAEPVTEGPDPALVAAMGVLTDEQREVVGLRFIADLSLEDVAELTGRPVGAVKAMQHRALGTLARTLGPTSPGEGS